MIRLVVLLLFIIANVSADLTVNTKYGPVQGYSTSSSNIWKGIPFAAPPIGNLRWQLPTPPKPWSNVLQTTTFGNICSQIGGGGSEDCLYLNVYAPISSSSTSKLPVLVFVYGGSFVTGESNYYDGSYLSGNAIIVVTLNYRLGPFGFLAHPSLLATNPDNTTGFFGVQDQRFALQWIQDNIAAFGGDPNKVTLSGESAGAISVCTHLATPRSAQLFSQALMESGFCDIYEENTGFANGQAIASKLDCSGTDAEIVKCLYGASQTQIIAASNTFSFYPVLNPYEIQEQPISLIRDGQFNQVPLLAGTNQDEMSYFYCPTDSGMSQLDYETYVKQTYPQYSTLLLQTYPGVPTYPSPVAAKIDLASDEYFKCTTLDLFQAYPSNIATYMYSFERAPAFRNSTPCFGAAHSYELYFLYPSVTFLVGGQLTAEEQVLSEEMRDAWVSFVITGTPSFSSDNPDWVAFDSDTQPYTILDLDLSTATAFRQSYCAVWHQIWE